jgi:hypothetical protein
MAEIIDLQPTLQISTKSTVIELFECFFPVDYLKMLIIPESDKYLDKVLAYGELLGWFGLCFLVATTNGAHRHDFWVLDDIDAFTGAPLCFGHWMSRNRFDDIRNLLRLSTDNIPPYQDCFLSCLKSG